MTEITHDSVPLQQLIAQMNLLLQQQQDLLHTQRTLYRQTQALFSLFSLFQFRAPLPPMGGWVIAPDFAVLLIQQIYDCKPRTVVELGGGVSTLISAYALEKLGRGHVTAIDHAPGFAQNTQHNIQRHGLEAVAAIIHAPLTPLTIGERQWQWYDTTAFAHLTDIDLLVIDGPPQYDNPQPMVRYPALPVLFDRLKAGATILLDDADREDEQEAVAAWLKEFAIEEVRSLEAEKGARLFRKR